MTAVTPVSVALWQDVYHYLTRMGVEYGLNLLCAALILFIGWWVAKLAKRIFEHFHP